MAANFFEQASDSENYQKPTVVSIYNPSLRFAALQIALSVPDIEARPHALAYFLAEEKEYCSRFGEKSSHLYIQAKAAFEDVARRAQILQNAKRMADFYESCRYNEPFERSLTEIMTQIDEKPISELIQTYALLRSFFFQLSEHSRSIERGI